jgi:very-short-patch-repair endonuclease
MLDGAIAAFGSKQLGLVTRAQVLTVATPRQLQRRVERGQLLRVRSGVYRIAGSPESWDQHLLAACLGGGPTTVASYRCAAVLWGFAGAEHPELFEVTVPRDRRARLPGVLVHDSRVLGGRHVTRNGVVPVTTPARTLCDLTAYWTYSAVERAVDDALRRKLTALRTLRAVFLDLATQGRRRSTVMRAVLDDRMVGVEPGESAQEQKIARWLVNAGLPEPVQQQRVRVGVHRYRLDLAYPQLKIAIEYNGWDAHSTRTAFDRDRMRDIELEDEDWRVLHFTSRSTRDFVIDRVHRAIRSRSK